MSVLALAFFSDLQATIRARLLSKGRSLLAAACMEPPPAMPRDKPYLLRDAGLDHLRRAEQWRETMDRHAVYRSLWML
ncbi:hypothetical protein [Ensifer sp. 4252]|uniref:hypothetical protein n=1 Tax=Ensifer sp. 4252 TaxID=3373915 RepID=UPI003D23DB49